MQDCEFTITPDGYNESSHSAYGCDFYLFGDREASLIDVDIFDTTIYVKKAIPNIRCEGESFIEHIYPLNSTGAEHSISIKIIYEE